MNSKRILLSPPHMGGTEQTYIAQAFQDNWIAPTGPHIDLFENRLVDFLDEKSQVVALNSGTAAIHLGLQLLGVQKGDVVLCQSLTFIASVNPVLYLGATPVFIGSEKETWNLCPIALEEAVLNQLNKGIQPKAILVVHLYGMPAKMNEIITISKKYNIPILEDAAEALGSSYTNQPCGTFGDFGVFSFNGNKIITTSGGGALLCHSEAVKKKAVFLATQAKEDAVYYEHTQVGYNYRMSNISASIGLGQLEVLSEHIQHRKQNHHFYKPLFENLSEVTLHQEPNEDFISNHWLTVIQLASFEQREALRLHLEKYNIESRPVWKPMHLQPLFQDNLYFGDDLADKLFDNGLCLPSGSNLSEEDKNCIKEAIELFFN
ncbi:MAG: aminotransferase class I/II-fold pyridoxal phosphate-dependent enzyme [Flavobacterium sp.]|nr:MAG: aminotransferase class I/II-fold pyridoxal phosphate-dependent enzyme [Flavobacterium sp.]